MVRDRCGDGRARSKHSIALPKYDCSAVNAALKRERAVRSHQVQKGSVSPCPTRVFFRLHPSIAGLGRREKNVIELLTLASFSVY